MTAVHFEWRGAFTNAEVNEWLHVDFDDDLRPFYFDACGFRPTNAGLMELRAPSTEE
ncbi:MAG: hypothetical protein HY828_17985 [Actinobacteria bacterium]|nr:hypothetical protein [Actinomycetota bacterium]